MGSADPLALALLIKPAVTPGQYNTGGSRYGSHNGSIKGVWSESGGGPTRCFIH